MGQSIVNDPEAPRRVRLVNVTQVMSTVLDPKSPVRPLLIGVSTTGTAYWFAVNDKGEAAGWVPILPYEAQMRSKSEIEAAAEAVVAAEDMSPSDGEQEPLLVTGGAVHRTLRAVKDIERGKV